MQYAAQCCTDGSTYRLDVRSIAYAKNINQPDTSKMSYELISALDSTDEIEVLFNSRKSRIVQCGNLRNNGYTDDFWIVSTTWWTYCWKTTDVSQLSTFSIVKHMELNVPIEHFYLPADQNNTESRCNLKLSDG